MIKKRLSDEYPDHDIVGYLHDIYVSDYTEQTKTEIVKRAVEIFEKKPSDIECFSLLNPAAIKLGSVVYDKCSFTDGQGNTLSQCECVVFPYDSDSDSWVLFLELKYCLFKNAKRNLNKAKDQLFATCSYFVDKQIVSRKQVKYLIVSLPKQSNVPFEGFIVSQGDLAVWKRRDGIIFKGVNEASIKNKILLDLE